MAALVATICYAQNSPNTKPATSSGSTTPTADKKAVSPGERVVLKVGNTQITEAEFEARIEDIEGQGDADREGSTQKDRRRLGDDYVSVLMLSQQAVENHLDATPEVIRKLEVDRIQILSDAEFARLMNRSKPTSDEVMQYYNAHQSEYEEVQIRRLFLWKRGPDSKNTHGLSPEIARARADEILKASAAGADTTPLAEAFKNSDVALLDQQPLTFPRGELPPAMEKAAFSSQVGKWSQVQETAESIILIQLLKRNRQQLGEVASLIETRLQNQNMEAKLNELKKRAGVWMDEQYFGTATGANQKPGSSSDGSAKLQDSTGNGEGKNEH